MIVKDFEKRKMYSEVSGVTALIDPNIKIQMNKYGYYEEFVLNKNPDDNLVDGIEFVSPNFNTQINEFDIAKKYYGSNSGIKYNKDLGFYLGLYTGHVTEGNFRVNGSSGGVGTWILKELFEKDKIDYVIHVKENIDKNSNVLFKYDISDNVDEIIKGAKTKYYPVELSEVLKMVEKNPGRYALVGIPSFIMAVRLLAEVNPIIKERISFTIGLVCGHQKSSKFSEYIGWQLGIKPGNLNFIDFRKKDLDKPANHYSVEVTGTIAHKVVTIQRPITELVGQNWGQGFFKIECSDFTDDVMNETADVTLGDAWLPEYTKDSLGNNIIVVRSKEILDLIKNSILEGKIEFEEVSEDIIIASQLAHIKHTKGELGYRLYLKSNNDEWYPQKRVEKSNDLKLSRKLIQKLRYNISHYSHIFYNEAVERNDLQYFEKKMKPYTRMYSYIYLLINAKKNGYYNIIKSLTNRIIHKIKKGT